jgi:hypothetical protein
MEKSARKKKSVSSKKKVGPSVGSKSKVGKSVFKKPLVGFSLKIPKSVPKSTTKKQSLMKIKGKNEVLGRSKRPVYSLKMRIKKLDTDLTDLEDALFMLFEVFHDIIHDARGDATHNLWTTGICEPKLKILCEKLIGLGFLLDSNPDKNTKLTTIYKYILERLAKGTYTNFEKLILFNIIEFTTTYNENLEINELRSRTLLGRIGYIFHDAGYEEQYATLGATTISTVGNIDQWERHPGDENLERDIDDTILSLQGLTMGGVPEIRKFKKGNQIRLKFNYFDTLDGRSITPVYIRIIFHTDDDTSVHQSYKFSLSVGSEDNFDFFPNDEPRRHCFSVAEAKEYLARHFHEAHTTKTGCPICLRQDTLFCPHVLKIFAMKAVGDKITFLDAKYHGTTALRVQTAAVTHDRLAAAYLIRDMDKRLERNPVFRNNSNLVLPLKYYNWNIGKKGGLNTSNPRFIVINNKGAGIFRELGRREIVRQEAHNRAGILTNAYGMGSINTIGSIRELIEREGLNPIEALSRVEEQFSLVAQSRFGPGGLKKTKKTKKKRKNEKNKKPRKKRKSKGKKSQ